MEVQDTGVIYKMIFPDNSAYIGQTKNLQKRMESYSNLDCKSQKILYRKLKEYGFNNCTVLTLCTIPRKDLDKVEIDMILSHNTCFRYNPERGLNILCESFEEYIKIKHTLPIYPKGRKIRKIAQYDVFDKLLKVWESSMDIAKELKWSHRLLIKSISKKTYFHSFKFKWINEKKK